MESNPFRKASRGNAKLRLCLQGPAGAGKTLSALRIAKGLAEKIQGKIAFIDTEKRSSELYAGQLQAHQLPEGWEAEFDVLSLNPPYMPKKYIKAIKAAEQHGYQILIIDSASHEWYGEGGILDMVEKAKGSSKNDFAAWKLPTQEHTAFIEAILQSECHVIACMRTKTAYDLVKDDKTGRSRPVKLGQAPIQREGTDFEFTTVLDLDVETHMATASKDRTNLFDGRGAVLLTEEQGHELYGWLFVENAKYDYCENDSERMIST